MLALWALIPSTFKWLGLVVLIGALGLGAWKWEHAAKLKAEAEAQLFKTAAGISQEQVLGYQERAEIQAKATKKRGQLNDWQRQGDLDSLSGDFNASGGVRGGSGAASSKGSPQPATRGKFTDRTGAQYQEAP